MEFEYRVLVDNIMVEPGWTSNLDYIEKRVLELREVNPRAIIYVEISPWYWLPGKETYWEAECPGCEYIACPTVTRRKNDMLG